MSINAAFRELSAEEEERLRREPSSVTRLIGLPGEDAREFLAAVEVAGGFADAAKVRPEAAANFLRGLLLRMAPSRAAFEQLLRKGQGVEVLIRQAEPLSPALAAEARKDPLALARFAFPEGQAEILRLGKAWHGVHWLLNGVAEGGTPPLDEIVTGGEPIGPDLAYGPATILSAGEVKALSQALDALPAATVQARFDLDRAFREGIYGISENADREWLGEAYAQLAALYDFAARNGHSVLRWLG